MANILHIFNNQNQLDSRKRIQKTMINPQFIVCIDIIS